MSRKTKKNTKTSYSVLPEQMTFSKNSSVYIRLFRGDKKEKIQSVWELELENGERDSGRVKRNRINFNSLPVGHHKLKVIIGTPLLGKGTKIFECSVHINDGQ